MLKDFSPKLSAHLRRKPVIRLRYLLALLISVGFLFLSRSPYTQSPDMDAPRFPSGTEIPLEADRGTSASEAPIHVEERWVRRGDTLYGILKNFGLPDVQILAASRSRVDGIDPSRLVAGRSYRLYLKEGRVVEYHYEPDEEKMVRLRFGEDGPALTVESIPYEIERVVLSNSIQDSLFAAVESMGEKPSLALDIADIFAWQVDFFRDLRKGDSFTILVDKYHRNGEFVRYGRILAAEFINDGKKHMAYLFRSGDGREDYFDGAGGSLRKQFLKTPLRFRRVSSGFSKKRLHPVTGKMTAHLGVDYTAPVGTPVMVIGDGKVVLRKHDSVNGRIIKVRHNSVYSSAYAHLRGYANGIKVGSAVRQGQIIGYVGMSGRATGPHLHFAMYRNGKYVDPRRISVPGASRVSQADRGAFKTRVEELDALLRAALGDKIALAKDH
jgi:murein DD-endopeptidase MepM/ murein hydrolase activator NlpD